MRTFLRARITYANVVATLALFVALGGSSYAAVKIGSKQIKNNSVRSADLRNNDIRGGDIRNGTIGGSDVRESSLGTVPRADAANLLGGRPPSSFLAAGAKAADSDKLDGVDSAGFVQGAGKSFLGHTSIDLTSTTTETRTSLGTIPGLGSFSLGGSSVSPGDDCRIVFTNTSGNTLVVNGDPNPGLDNNGEVEIAGIDARPQADEEPFTILSARGTKVASGIAIVDYGFPDANLFCDGAVQAIHSG